MHETFFAPTTLNDQPSRIAELLSHHPETPRSIASIYSELEVDYAGRRGDHSFSIVNNALLLLLSRHAYKSKRESEHVSLFIEMHFIRSGILEMYNILEFFLRINSDKRRKWIKLTSVKDLRRCIANRLPNSSYDKIDIRNISELLVFKRYIDESNDLFYYTSFQRLLDSRSAELSSSIFDFLRAVIKFMIIFVDDARPASPANGTKLSAYLSFIDQFLIDDLL